MALKTSKSKTLKQGPEPVTVVIVVMVALLIVFAVFGVAHAAKNHSADAKAADVVAKYGKTPTGVDTKSQGVLVTGKDVFGDEAAVSKTKPVTVTIFEDFQCPACKAFNDLYADRLDALLKDGTVQVDYRPVAILNKASTTDYSTRSMGAAMCVLDEGGKKGFHEAVKLLFADQPEEQTAGLSNNELKFTLNPAFEGNHGKFQSCIDDGGFEPFTHSATEKAGNEGLQHTPTIKVNGKEVDGPDSFQQLAANLDAAIAEAAAK